MSAPPRRSARTNKGTHSSRDLLDVYYKDDEELQSRNPEPGQDADFVPTQTTNDDVVEDHDDRMTHEGDVRCDPCGTTQANYNEDTDEGGTMIECEGCATWQHTACMGYKTKRAIPAQYTCNRCEPKRATEETPVEPKPKRTKLVATKSQIAKKATPQDRTRASVAAALAKVLVRTHPESKDSLEETASNIEAALHTWAGTTDKRYIDKSRNLMTLIKKPAVYARVVSGALSLKDLVELPPEEVDSELKDYAEKVRQELIRRSVLTVDEGSQRIRRTHKGEEVVETPDDGVSVRSIDHRIFAKDEEKQPREEKQEKHKEKEKDDDRPHVGVSGPNLYQLADDEENEENEEPEADHKDDAAIDNDSDDELDIILGKTLPELPKLPKPKLPPTMSRRFWSGDLVFPDFVEFSCRAELVGCTNYVEPHDVTTASFHNRAVRVCKELLDKPRYSIEGRLDRAKADAYVSKITASRDLYMVRLDADDTAYNKLYEYLATRKKVGVLSNRAPFVKDAYVYALEDAPPHLQLGPVTRGLYVVFVVRKDYVPVGKSILKKALPAPKPVPIAKPPKSTNLDSILSKLGEPQQQQQQQHIPQEQVQQQNLNSMAQFLDLTPEQLRYLSELVSQNPHVQLNPQALLNLLQNNQMPGYY